MRIQCDCGKFQAELKAFPKATPGRLMCYCDDCQMYLMELGRTDLLDAAGGTEVIPAYPTEMEIVQGKEHLKCTRLSAAGMHRWSTTCCNSPIANTRPGSSWLGVHRNMYTAADPGVLERTLGDIRGRIMGKFAKGPTPPGTPAKMNLKAAIPVLPYMLKGALGGKGKTSPFVGKDGAPLAKARTLTDAERTALKKRWESVKAWKG